jgi:general secretion pathway protein M
MAFGDLATRFRASGVGRWYYGRESNERMIIAGVAVLVVVSLAWVLVWQPVAEWRALEQNRFQNAQRLFDTIKANEVQLRRANTPANNARRSLIPIINKAANAHELKLNRLQPESNGVISVLLQQQSFNQIIQWVAQLEENNDVTVEQANFDSQDAPGYVNANIRLN